MSRGQYASSSIYSRRQYTDVFYNDPFKIQSYNFRYADRPVYQVQHYQRPQPMQTKEPTFETYYRNPKYSTKNQERTTSSASSSFAEHKRRSFLHDFKCISTPLNKVNNALVSAEVRTQTPQLRRQPVGHPSGAVPNVPLLRTCCNQAEYQTMRRGQSVTTLIPGLNATHRGNRSASVTAFKEPERNYSTSTFKLSSKCSGSSCSGCAINININGLESETELNKRLRIKINTDACLYNNADNCKVHKSHTTGIGSSESFVIDKRLSKFSLPEAQIKNWARKSSCEHDLLIAKRQLVKSERQRIEDVCQQELQKEQHCMRLREEERERLRRTERQLDREKLLELEAERQRHKLRELERETQRKREHERVDRYQYQPRNDRQHRLPMRAMSMPTSVTAPVVMTSHLYRPASTDRLPGMVPCNVNQSTATPQATRAERLQICTRNLTTLRSLKPQISPQQEHPTYASTPKGLERRSSGSSNYNASVRGCGSNCSLYRLSATRLNERKLLNLHVNGVPVSSNQPIHTKINNMPIRITTSQPVDDNLQFSLNKVRIRNVSPTVRPVQERRRSCSSNNLRQDESASMPYNVNINVYADNLRTMRL